MLSIWCEVLIFMPHVFVNANWSNIFYLVTQLLFHSNNLVVSEVTSPL